jgi:hypothetical protein
VGGFAGGRAVRERSQAHPVSTPCHAVQLASASRFNGRRWTCRRNTCNMPRKWKRKDFPAYRRRRPKTFTASVRACLSAGAFDAVVGSTNPYAAMTPDNLQFQFLTDVVPRRALTRLARALKSWPRPEGFTEKTALARIYGHSSWTALFKSIDRTATATPLDADCSPGAILERRRLCVDRLDTYARETGAALPRSAEDLIVEVQPMAGNPKGDALTASLKGTPQGRTQVTAAAAIIQAHLRDGQELDEAGKSFVLAALASGTAAELDYVGAWIGPDAVDLVNLQVGPRAEFGFGILQKLSFGGDTFSRVGYAQALLYGWGCERDFQRALVQLEWVAAELEKKERPAKFIERSSYGQFHRLCALAYAMVPGVHRSLAKSLKHLRQAGEFGDRPAMLLLRDAYTNGEQPLEYKDFVKPDVVEARKYALLLAGLTDPALHHRATRW